MPLLMSASPPVVCARSVQTRVSCATSLLRCSSSSPARGCSHPSPLLVCIPLPPLGVHLLQCTCLSLGLDAGAQRGLSIPMPQGGCLPSHPAAGVTPPPPVWVSFCPHK